MNKTIFALIILLFSCLPVMAQTSTSSALPIIKEEDGDPAYRARVITVPNGSLGYDISGSVTFDTHWEGADPIIYYTGGNVGIGTTSPRGKLDVDGYIYFSNIATYDSDHDSFTDGHQLVDKEYVDIAVTAINTNYYMLDSASTISDYKNTQIDIPVLAEATDSTLVTTTDTYLQGWISPEGGTLAELVSGTYDLYIEAKVNATAGYKRINLYWQLYEYKTDTSEVLIGTSEDGDELTITDADQFIHFILASDYMISSGSRIIGKVYAKLTGSGSNPTVTLTYLGNVRSHFAVPSNIEVLKSIFVPYSGASSNVDLGIYTLTNDTSIYTSEIWVDYIYGDGSNLTGVSAANPTANAVPVSTGSTLVDSGIYAVNGNVGIGSTNPNYRLVVDQSAYIGNSLVVGSGSTVYIEPVCATADPCGTKPEGTYYFGCGGEWCTCRSGGVDSVIYDPSTACLY